MKKNLFSSLVVLIAFTMITGCAQTATPSPATSSASPAPSPTDSGEFGDTGGIILPIVTEPIEITFFTASQFTDRTSTFVIQELSRRTGINVKVMEAPSADRQTRAQTMAASGVLPDILSSGSFSELEVIEMGIGGLLVPITQHLDIVPNFKTNFVNNPENNWVLTAGAGPDGNLYAYPRFECTRPVNHSFMYRKDIFDKNNIPLWKTPDEFYQALKKLKEIYPESSPYASKMSDTVFNLWAFSWGLPDFPKPYYDFTEKVWKPAATDPAYKDMLDFMKKLYNEKLIDIEFLTDTAASWITKMSQPEQAFVTFDWISRPDMFYETVKETMPEYDLRYAPPVGPAGYNKIVPDITPIGGIMIAKNKNYLTALKLVDYLASPSGAELMTLGVEGEIFTWNDQGKPVYEGFPPEKVLSILDLEEKFGLFIGDVYVRMDPRCIYFNYSEKEKEVIDDTFANDRSYEPAPYLMFGEDDQSALSDVWAEYDTKAKEFSTIYILNPSYGDAEWDAWLKQAKDLGEDQMIGIYNKRQVEMYGN